MFFVYILYSQKCQRYYVGYTSSIEGRLLRHNAGFVTATKNCRPYIVKGYKAFNTEQEALTEERRIKKQKSSKYIEHLLNSGWQARPD